MRTIERRHLLPGAAAFSAALAVALLGLNAGAEEPEAESRTVELQPLGVNDFHGHLEPPVPGLGGAAWLGAHLDRAAGAAAERTITVHAGDMIGASPLISSHFDDEPAIEAMNLMAVRRGSCGQPRVRRGRRGAVAGAARLALPVARGEHGRPAGRQAAAGADEGGRAAGVRSASSA